MAKTKRGGEYVPCWRHALTHGYALSMAADQGARLANDPAGPDRAERLRHAAEIVEGSAGRLAIIAAAVEADPRPPKGTPKPFEGPAVVTLPPLVPGGCEDLYRLAVATAEVAGDAARLGSSKLAAFVPGAMKAVAERAKVLAAEWEVSLLLVMTANTPGQPSRSP